MRQNGNGSASGEATKTVNGETRTMDEALVRIEGVKGARLTQDPNGTITEVHVLAAGGRAPKQVVRDVQSMLRVEYGVEVDYRVISIVQIDDVPVPSSRPAAESARPAIARVAADAEGSSSTVTVELELAGRRLTGSARGAAHASWRLAAQATVDALGDIVGDQALEIEFAGIVTAGQRQVALVSIRAAGARGDSMLTGSANTRRDAHDAIARATLDALNRLLGETH